MEFQALVLRKKHLESFSVEDSTFELDPCFRDTRIEDLCLDFTLPGYPDYVLSHGADDKMVNLVLIYHVYPWDSWISNGLQF